MKKVLFTTILTLAINLTFSQKTVDVFDIARKGTIAEAKEALKENPKAFNTVNQDGFTPLILASYRNNIEVAKFIIANGADINANSAMGTPLMAAVVKGNIEIVKLLLDKHANVNSTDANKTTALLYASMFKNYEIARLLVKAKADPDFKDNKGNSAIDYAILANDDTLIEILKTK
jgi:hypothetical protein